MEEIMIRVACEEDAAELLKIYTPYVEETAITFEYEVPSPEEFRDRIRTILQRYPYLVAMRGNTIVGYAYAGVFKGRAAYDWAVETTIYLRRDCRHMGVGKQLYGKLEEILKRQGILNLNACIAVPVTEDERLTMDSVHFHEKEGYATVGRFTACGYKFHCWYDMVWMEKIIGEHRTDQPDVIWFRDFGTID